MIKKNPYCLFLFWLAIFGILFAFLQTNARFYFYYIEQFQQFQNTWYYLKTNLFEPAGGFSIVVSGFLNSFFLYPYAGAAITAALLTVVGWLTNCITRRISPQAELLPLCLLPVIVLLFMHFDSNYLPFGTVAFILMLVALNLILLGKTFHLRLICHLIAIVSLFYTAGSIFMLYASIVTIYELFNISKRRYLVVLVLIAAFFIGFACVHFGKHTTYRYSFLPDNYFNISFKPGILLYLSWLSILFIVTAACLIRKMKKTLVIIQLLLVAGLGWWGIQKYTSKVNSDILELDYYCRTAQWDKVTGYNKGSLNNYLSMCYLNIALAQKGELGDKAFMYDQAGMRGILYPWDKTANSSQLLSEIYFAMNDIALSQKMAFESYIITGNPRMLKRLVQTNLIYGAYAVAEKYISRLEEMRGYRNWAKAHRRFLNNDPAIEQDELLGSKRKSLEKVNYLSRTEGIDIDLQNLAIFNLSERNAIEYAGVIYLLNKDMDRFRHLIEANYKTDILLKLPISFQEAILFLSLEEEEAEYWLQYDIPKATVQRFAEFIKTLSTQNNSPQLQKSMKSLYWNTYWYYYVFK